MLNWCICNRLVYYDKLTPRHSRQLMNTRQCRDTFRLLVVHNLPDSYSDTSHPYWYICTDMPCTESIRLYLNEFENIFRKWNKLRLTNTLVIETPVDNAITRRAGASVGTVHVHTFTTLTTFMCIMGAFIEVFNCYIITLYLSTYLYNVDQPLPKPVPVYTLDHIETFCTCSHTVDY